MHRQVFLEIASLKVGLVGIAAGLPVVELLLSRVSGSDQALDCFSL